MKTAIRIILCTFLIAIAVTMATFTIAGFTAAKRRAPQNSLYVLGDLDGSVAVYSGADPAHPLTVTEIETASLRERDRELITGGLPVDSPEELARLLEDLGS